MRWTRGTHRRFQKSLTLVRNLEVVINLSFGFGCASGGATTTRLAMAAGVAVWGLGATTSLQHTSFQGKGERRRDWRSTTRFTSHLIQSASQPASQPASQQPSQARPNRASIAFYFILFVISHF